MLDTMLKERILEVRRRMGEAAALSGRTSRDILLVGATKTQPPEIVAEAMPYLDAAGENRVQELVEKRRARAYGDGRVHFIGHLQTNKADKVAGEVDLIESVDSLRIAGALSAVMKKKGGRQDILLEINIGGEASKSGIRPEETEKIMLEISKLPGLKVRGLMTIPPICEKTDDLRRYFSNLRKVFVDIKEKKYDNISMDFLSMGMSSDYFEAILEGANIVRIGQALFGKRA